MTTSHLEYDNANTLSGQQLGSSNLPNLPPPISHPPQPSSIPANTESTSTGPLPQSCIGINPDKSSATAVYEGYQFFKADPMPGSKATWTRVERTEMHLTQSEFYKLVQKRANKVSAAQQYQNLSDTRRAHVNQLIHEQRRLDPSVEWSCVYAKERDRPAKARNAHRDDYETVSMDIILMKRSLRPKSYPRTPMGDLVDLNVPFRLNGIEAHKINNVRPDPVSPERLAEIALSRYQSIPTSTQPLVPANSVPPAGMVQGPLPRPVSVTSPFNRLDLGPGQILKSHEDSMQLLSHSLPQMQYNLDLEPVNYSSDSDISDEDTSSTSDHSQSDMSSALDEETMDCDDPEPLQPPHYPRQHSCSPARRDSGPGPHRHRRSNSRHVEQRHRRLGLKYHSIDMVTPSQFLSGRRTRSSRTTLQDSISREQRYRIKRMDDDELCDRLLECEATLNHLGKALKDRRLLQKNKAEAPQLQRCQSFYDFSSMRHCGCNCQKDTKMADAD